MKTDKSKEQPKAEEAVTEAPKKPINTPLGRAAQELAKLVGTSDQKLKEGETQAAIVPDGTEQPATQSKKKKGKK